MNRPNNISSLATATGTSVRYKIGGGSRPGESWTGGPQLAPTVDDVGESRPQYRFAFVGLLVFTLLLYMRPHEMFPEVFGAFSLIRIVAILALAAYFIPRLLSNQRLTIIPIELKMLGILFLLGVAFTPLASSPADSLEVLIDLFIKVVAIFVLMINIINTRARLRMVFALVVFCGTVLALLAINSYITGDFKMIVKNDGYVVGMRIFGPVGGIVGNPNDLATSLDMLLPLAIMLAFTSKGLIRALYLACAGILAGGVVVTFSRGGFLGLLAMGAVMLWKAGRRNRAVTAMAFLMLFGVFALAMPSGYAGRISSIFNIGEDPTGSSQGRRDLLERAVSVAIHHPLVGIGMGNFHTYSIGEQVAHNSYVETAAELGLAGLAAYLVLIFAPLRSLRKIERETVSEDPGTPVANRDVTARKEIHYISIALQAVIVAYMVCSFFGSIEYQWFLYYPVAYAIALRQIFAAGKENIIPSGISPRADTTESNRRRGVLWERYARAGRASASATR